MKNKTILIISFLLFFTMISIPVQAVADENTIFNSVTWTEDSENVVLVGQNEIRKFPVPELDPQIRMLIGDDENTYCDFNEALDLAAAVTNHETINFYNMATGKRQAEIFHETQIMDIDFSSTGKCMISDGTNISAMIYDSNTGDLLNTLTGFTTAAPVFNAVFSRDEKSILWHARGSFMVQKISDQSLGAEIHLWDFSDAYLLNSDASLLAAATADDKSEGQVIVFFDTATGEEKGRTTFSKTPITAMTYEPSEDVLFAADSDTIYQIQMSDYSILSEEHIASATETSDEHIRDISASPDGKYLAVLCGNNTLQLISFAEE